MTQNHIRQNQTPEELALEVEIFDLNGRVDAAATNAANAEIFHPSNTVYVDAFTSAPATPPKTASTAVHKAATLAKQTTAKARVLARLK